MANTPTREHREELSDRETLVRLMASGGDRALAALCYQLLLRIERLEGALAKEE